MTIRRRILIALDPAAPRRDALEAIAALGTATPLELTAIFIEDENLSRLATLPFAREVRLTGYSARALDAELLRMQFDACAREFERAFAEARARLRAQVEFRILRGDVLEELARAATGVDLLVVARSVRSAGLRTWLGVPAERLVEAVARGPAPVGLLFVHEPWASGRSVLILDDGSEAAERAREQARLIAESERLPLEVCRLGESAAAADYDEAELVPDVVDLASLRRLCAERDPRLLVLPDTTAVRDHIDLHELLNDLPASVAITR